jgi:hypothetical protein
VQFHTLCSLLGGYEWARAEHFILTILFTLFFIVHIVQVIIAGWNNFRSMVTGLDVLPVSKEIIFRPAVINTQAASPVSTSVEKHSEAETIQKEPDLNPVILKENNHERVADDTSAENPDKPNPVDEKDKQQDDDEELKNQQANEL